MTSTSQPRVCVSLCEPTLEALTHALAEQKDCELVELRLDCLDKSDLDSERITELLKDFRGDSILTLLAREQNEEIDHATRLAFWSSAIFSESYFDVELGTAEKVLAEETHATLPVDWSRTICSYHDFIEVPANLAQIYERLIATPAAVLKIAALAHDATDCLPLFQLLERARSDGRQMIALAMGPAGIATRVLGPSLGAFLTYASPADGKATAPGQLSASELTETYRIDGIDRQTEIFGLIGSPVSHSLSPHIHNASLSANRLNGVFLPLEVKDVASFIKRMVRPGTREINWNARGFSVTAPHKIAVMEQLDWVDPAALGIGAVNTIVVKDDSLLGYNTDAPGFMVPLTKIFGDLRGANCAVIGAGGAANALLWALRSAEAMTTVFARDPQKASELAQRFGARHRELNDANFTGFDVVVNATPVGSSGPLENETAVIAGQLRGARLAYDLVYNPTETMFLREAREAGCQVLGGLAMLLAQAVEQFKLWTGIVPDEGIMLEAARRKLDKSRR
jgi:3-dehydroquinate dehydratase/shikimate dehydrogenase